MRTLSVALGIAVAAHAALLAWLSTDAPARTTTAAVPRRAAPPAPTSPAVEPMVVEIVDLSGTSSGGDAGRVERAPHGAAHRVAIATAGQGAAGGERETGSPGSSGTGLMKMRGPDAPSFGLSPAFIERFLEQSKPVPPKDTEAERVADDLANERAALNDPSWIAHASPDEVMAMREALVADLDRRDHLELHPAGGGRFTSEHTVHDMNGAERESFGVIVAPDGTVTFHDARNLQLHGLGGSFDVTDWAMRSQGDDPYAHEKLAWLDRTRDDRVAIGKRHEREVLAHTPQVVQRNVEWAWNRARDLATRKRDLFELWDECAESGDDDVVAAGTTARSYVIGFILAKLPPGSPDAYTVAELAELNAHRQSKQAFAPYTD